MIYFLDTSALIKRYLNETGSVWVRDLTDSPEHVFVASRLTTTEIISAFARRLREGTVTRTQYADHRNAFDDDCATRYHIIELENNTFDLARDLIERHPLRTLDALQLASALATNRVFVSLNLSPLNFLSSDNRLLQIAQHEGLSTDNPNHYAL
ncbi:MAG: type II toxin-antitoxin system VapC family toxin [Chloroflexi bacterium]|nr:type II toxin-antitoxin system VapC family toxin [Chloroflexota bacterium]